MFGPHFEGKNEVFSMIARQSLGVLKVSLFIFLIRRSILNFGLVGNIPKGCLDGRMAVDQGVENCMLPLAELSNLLMCFYM